MRKATVETDSRRFVNACFGKYTPLGKWGDYYPVSVKRSLIPLQKIKLKGSYFRE